MNGVTIAKNASNTSLSTGSAVYSTAGGKVSNCIMRDNKLNGAESVLGGAALYVENNGKKIFVLNKNHIYRNDVTNCGNAEGGAVRINHANCSVRNNKFEDNLLISEGGIARGAAISVLCTLGLSPDSYVELYGNEFRANQLIVKEGFESYGGAVSIYNIRFAIKNNQFSDNYCENQSSMVLGSALHIDNVSDLCILENNIFNANEAAENTVCFGTVSVQNTCNALIRSNTLSNNSMPAGYGGAVFLHNVTDTDVINNYFQCNEADGIGGIYIEHANVNMYNNIITGNRALNSFAGGIFIYTACSFLDSFSSPLEKIRENQNKACSQNSLLKSSKNTTLVKLLNNTITNNSACTSAGGLYAYGALEITNCIFWGNNAASEEQMHLDSDECSVTYSNIEGGYSGSGNIMHNPVFIDEENFYLDPQLSPCVDAGHFLSTYNDREDPQNPGAALYPSLGTIRNDMGAWGGPFTAVVEAETESEENSYASNSAADGLNLKNYPNPFNPTTTISYQLPAVSLVDLSIYNVLGQKVTSLVSEKQQAGNYKVEWNAAGFSSGVYFYRMETGKGFVQSRKLILLK